MTDWTERELRAALGVIVQRANSDLEFRMRALEDARAVLHEVAGKALPVEIVFRFIELESGELGIFVPRDPQSVELSDEELDEMAGGGFINSFFDTIDRYGQIVVHGAVMGLRVGVTNVIGSRDT